MLASGDFYAEGTKIRKEPENTEWIVNGNKLVSLAQIDAKIP
jgi:hypothetical protein